MFLCFLKSRNYYYINKRSSFKVTLNLWNDTPKYRTLTLTHEQLNPENVGWLHNRSTEFDRLMTEDDFELTRSRTLVDERGIIMCVCKRGWAVMLEEVGVSRWLTRGRAVIVILAAKLVFSKSSTSTFATHYSSVWAPFQLQFTRTLRHQIFPAIHH